jgi:hypothetical protein
MAPLLGCLNPSISLVFHNGNAKMICLSDEACISEPQQLM